MHYKVSRYIIQISRFELVFNATSAEDARRQARAADTSTLQISSITMADRVGQAILTLTPRSRSLRRRAMRSRIF